jgi:DNA-directed RNA polymerase subunit RPC12/RpoP
MVKCSTCGREFPTAQALGGHVKNAHSQEQEKAGG